MTRKMAREEAFILIFEKAFNKGSVDEILELAAEVRELKPDKYIKTVFKGVFDNIEEIPNSVSINEAVELCKKYATKEDSAFLNGILSTVVKKL